MALRSELENVKLYQPWFLYVMTMLQISGTLVLVMLGGVTRIGVTPVRVTSGGYICICNDANILMQRPL